MRLGHVIALMREHWPFPVARGAVVSGYRALGVSQRHVLADIALRNYVFGDLPDGSEIQMAIAEGRRRCAMEICQLASTDADQLWALVEKKPTERGDQK